jgi:hypothetical protein
VTNPIAGIIARQLSTALATAALPGAPVRPEPGHGVEQTDWPTIAHAIHEHTSEARP